MDMEKLNYLLHHMRYDIVSLIDHVLDDSTTDPHYSAVTATNLIKCYMQVMKDLGEELPCSNVEEFFDYIAYPKEEYEAFEASRKKESEYYLGVQY